MPPPELKIQRLAMRFPSLERAAVKTVPGILPWNAKELDAWAASAIPSDGERYAAQFVLSIWDNAGNWQCGKFDVVDALRIWDPMHCAVFIEWANDPWWA